MAKSLLKLISHLVYILFSKYIKVRSIMKIPNDKIPQCYKYAKQAYEGVILPSDANQKIHVELNINQRSAKDYYLYFRYLMTGEKPTWKLNNYTMEYFLSNILKDYSDKEQKEKTIINFTKLIEKYEGDNVGSQRGMRIIYEKYISTF